MRQRHWFSEWYGVVLGVILDFTSWKIGFSWWSWSQVIENRMIVRFFLGPIELGISFRKDKLCK